MRSKISRVVAASVTAIMFGAIVPSQVGGAPAPTGPKTPLNPSLAASTGKGEWVTWGGDAGFERYAPLSQINEENVGLLQVAWRTKLLTFAGGKSDSDSETTPLMVGGVLYVSEGPMQASAMDPATGERIWTFTSPAYQTDRGGRGYAKSRGLAYWSDGKIARILLNTADGRLISVDAATGKADSNFGAGGQIFLKDQPSRPNEKIPHVGSSSPPTVVGDVVVAQVVGDLTAPQKEATPGFVRGFDVRTGKLLWTFHTIPQAGEFGNDTWKNGSWKYTGNTDIWTMMSADPQLGLVYLPIGEATQDFFGGHRPGANLFATSIVALDAKTGKRVWHFQLTHHGLWDYDPPAAPILMDIVVNGKPIKAIAQLTKQGFAFVFDRATGKPVWPIVERPVPQMPIPGDTQWPTQPIPTKPGAYSQQGCDDDQLIDFTPEIKREAREIAKKYVCGPLYTPPTLPQDGKIGTWVNPSMQGGPNWPGGAFDPDTGMLYVPARNTPMLAYLVPGDPKKTDLSFTRPLSVIIEGPKGLPINRPPWSTVTATDMNRGEHVWQDPIGGANDFIRNSPALKGVNLDFNSMGRWNINPGLLVTKTLMFMGEGGGLTDSGGPMLRAYDKATGRVVSEFELPANANAAPMTYMYKGRQYLVVAVSASNRPAELVALAVPDGSQQAQNAATPAATPTAFSPSAPVADSSAAAMSSDAIAAGAKVFSRNCAMCHGTRGEGREGKGPSIADEADPQTIRTMVMEGGVQMPPLTGLSPSDVDSVSRYVASGALKAAP